MESKYNYFKRDISWLSFNYRVLLEALDEHLPLYERINFISIYSSNLEEFYKIRVADHKVPGYPPICLISTSAPSTVKRFTCGNIFRISCPSMLP